MWFGLTQKNYYRFSTDSGSETSSGFEAEKNLDLDYWKMIAQGYEERKASCVDAVGRMTGGKTEEPSSRDTSLEKKRESLTRELAAWLMR